MKWRQGVFSVFLVVCLLCACDRDDDDKYTWSFEQDNGAASYGGESSGNHGFYLAKVSYGRPVPHEPARVVNPASIVEYEPLTGQVQEGYPKTLDPNASLRELPCLEISKMYGRNKRLGVVPRNAALVLEFTKEVEPGSLGLNRNSHFTPSSPIRVSSHLGKSIPMEVTVNGNRVILNPVTQGQVGFPPTPAGEAPAMNPDGFIQLHLLTSSNCANPICATDQTPLAERRDLAGSALKPIAFNSANAVHNSLWVGYNGFLPDVTDPRIFRIVEDKGKADGGTGNSLTDLSKSFLLLANNNAGEWAKGLLILRPGAPNEEMAFVWYNTKDTLYTTTSFAQPPAPNDPYHLKRAEFYEPIPGINNPQTAIDPIHRPKDPFDPEDLKNSDLYYFAFFDEWDKTTNTWKPVNFDYSKGPGAKQQVHPKWRINFWFTEPMDVLSFRPFENFLVCPNKLPNNHPAFNRMKIGRVTAREIRRQVSYEPVLIDQSGANNHQLIGLGGKGSNLRLVIRSVPKPKDLLKFYKSLGPPPSWPPEVHGDLNLTGVISIRDVSGRPLAFPKQFLDINSPHSILNPSSPGYGAFIPAMDFKYQFHTKTTKDPEYGALVHRFMGMPVPGSNPTGTVTGLIYNDLKPKIYGPRFYDTNMSANGFLGGHPVEFYEHVFDNYNPPGPNTAGLPDNTYPDPLFKVPFGVGTPITSEYGCRFQHVYRRTDCSPDPKHMQDTLLDLTGMAWAPIGGWVTNTIIDQLSIGVALSDRKPDTHHTAGIPKKPNSGLVQKFDNNIDSLSLDDMEMVVGDKNSGVPYSIDGQNLYAPKNAGPAFNLYHPWPNFNKPGFGYDSTSSMLIEYRLDPNSGPVSKSNGFTFHAGIMSSMLPRFRIFSAGDKNKLIYPVKDPKSVPMAWGPLAAPGSWGDNCRYFTIFDYVKRHSLIESPAITGVPGKDLYFMAPVINPTEAEAPAGSMLTLLYQSYPTENAASGSGWIKASDVEGVFNSGGHQQFEFVCFQAVFESNVDTKETPHLDTVMIPYKY